MEEALPGYMDPYAAVADVFDMRDFIEAYLDACFKGDTERYILHTEVSVEDAACGMRRLFRNFRSMIFQQNRMRGFKMPRRESLQTAGILWVLLRGTH